MKIETLVDDEEYVWRVNSNGIDVGVQKIIRCKDCKYFSQNDRWCERYECGDGDRLICWDLGEDGFCSKAEERIYCKDCKYSIDNDYCLFSTADMGEINKMDADDFCSRGERKDETN